MRNSLRGEKAKGAKTILEKTKQMHIQFFLLVYMYIHKQHPVLINFLLFPTATFFLEVHVTSQSSCLQ